MKFPLPATLIFLLFLTSCPDASENHISQLASKLTKYSMIIDRAVRYGKDDLSDLSETTLLNHAKKTNPSLHDSFKKYKVRVLVKEPNSLVLVCSEDGEIGLLEDMGCTARMDKYLFHKSEEALPCDFTLANDLERFCAD